MYILYVIFVQYKPILIKIVNFNYRYACAAVNTVGAAFARSHLVVFDPKDFQVRVK